MCGSKEQEKELFNENAAWRSHFRKGHIFNQWIFRLCPSRSFDTWSLIPFMNGHLSEAISQSEFFERVHSWTGISDHVSHSLSGSSL